MPSTEASMRKKTALVTGATGGIGKKIVSFLVEKNYFVIVHGRNEVAVEELCRCIDEDSALTRSITGNLNTESSRAEFIAKLLNEYEAVDILINNAGGGGAHESWWETTEQKWLNIFELNVMSMVALIKELAPGMVGRGWGRIINIASVSGIQPLSIGPEYAASKAAIINLTVSIAKELAGKGVTANSISPGLVLTEGVRQYLIDECGVADASDDDLDEYASKNIFPTLVSQLVRPEDIANTVGFLLTGAGSRITGQNISVDGRYTKVEPSLK